MAFVFSGVILCGVSRSNLSGSAPKILFVCLGNICRSPLAQAAFAEAAELRNLAIHSDSAGTGNWHIGKPPDIRAQATARKYGMETSHYRARQIEVADYYQFTHIFALDHENLSDIQGRQPADATARTMLLMDVVEGRSGEAVTDPYFGDEAGFEITWRDVTAAADALVAQLAADGDINPDGG